MYIIKSRFSLTIKTISLIVALCFLATTLYCDTGFAQSAKKYDLAKELISGPPLTQKHADLKGNVSVAFEHGDVGSSRAIPISIKSFASDKDMPEHGVGATYGLRQVPPLSKLERIMQAKKAVLSDTNENAIDFILRKAREDIGEPVSIMLRGSNLYSANYEDFDILVIVKNPKVDLNDKEVRKKISETHKVMVDFPNTDEKSCMLMPYYGTVEDLKKNPNKFAGSYINYVTIWGNDELRGYVPTISAFEEKISEFIAHAEERLAKGNIMGAAHRLILVARIIAAIDGTDVTRTIANLMELEEVGAVRNDLKNLEDYCRRYIKEVCKRLIIRESDVPSIAKIVPPPASFDIKLSWEINSKEPIREGEVPENIRGHLNKTLKRMAEYVKNIDSNVNTVQLNLSSKTSDTQVAVEARSGEIYLNSDILYPIKAFEEAHEALIEILAYQFLYSQACKGQDSNKALQSTLEHFKGQPLKFALARLFDSERYSYSASDFQLMFMRAIRESLLSLDTDACLLAFDVDETLLEKDDETLDSVPELRDILVDLLRQGVKIAIISGNSRAMQAKKVAKPIINALKDAPDNLRNLFMYTSGGGIFVGHDEVGEKKPEQLATINEDNIEKIRHAIEVALPKIVNKLTDDEKKVIEWWYTVKGPKEYNGCAFDYGWLRGEKMQIKVLSDVDIERMKNNGEKLPGIWLETRDDASLTIKPLPDAKKLCEGSKKGMPKETSDKLGIHTKLNDARELLMQILVDSLKDQMGDALIAYRENSSTKADLEMGTGGSTSVDITQRGIHKGFALKHLVETHLKGQCQIKTIIYFGDEYKSGGNDLIIVKLINEMKNLIVMSLMKKPEEMATEAGEYVLQIGRVARATIDFLRVLNSTPKEMLQMLRYVSENKISELAAMISGFPVEVRLFVCSIMVERQARRLEKEKRVSGTKSFPAGFEEREPKDVRAVVFDWEGTISEAVPWVKLMTKLALDKAYSVPTDEQRDEVADLFAATAGWPISDQMELIRKMVIAKSGENMAKTAVEYENEYYGIRDAYLAEQKANPEWSPLIPGVKDLIDKLHKEGIALYVLSGKRREKLLEDVMAAGLTEYFKDENLFGDGSFEGFNKTEALNRIKQSLNLKGNQVVMIGDAKGDMDSAKSAGLAAIGKAKDAKSERALHDAGAGKVVTDYGNEIDEVLKYLGFTSVREEQVSAAVESAARFSEIVEKEAHRLEEEERISVTKGGEKDDVNSAFGAPSNLFGLNARPVDYQEVNYAEAFNVSS